MRKLKLLLVSAVFCLILCAVTLSADTIQGDVSLASQTVNDSFNTALSISEGVSYGIFTYNGDSRFFVLDLSNEDRLESKFYTITSIDSNNSYPCLKVYNSNFVEIASAGDEYSTDCSFTYHFCNGSKYYFEVKEYYGNYADFGISVLSTPSSAYLDTNSITIGAQTTNTISVPYTNKVYEFKPYRSGEYLFFSSNNNSDPIGWLYNSSLVKLNANDDNNDSNNFALRYSLTAGQTYYLVAGNYSNGTGTYTINSLIPADIATDNYYIRSLSINPDPDASDINYYMDADTVNREWVQQNGLSSGNNEKWCIQKGSDGYYTIRSLDVGQKYMGASSTNIKLFTSVSDATKWNIFEDHDGKLFFESKSIPWNIIALNGINTGNNLSLSLLNSISNESHSWNTLLYDNALLVSYGADRNEYMHQVGNRLRAMYHKKFSLVDTDSDGATINSMITSMGNSEIFVMHTEGSQTGFLVGANDWLTMGHLNNVDLSNIKLAILLASYTGTGYSSSNITNNSPVNIVEKMILCGAETVIGFNSNIETSDYNRFAIDLSELIIVNGWVVGNSIDRMEYEFSREYLTSTLPYVTFAGNYYLRIR